MKTTPFTETHISLGAKMHEFAGYNMPIEYSGIIDEHLAVCQGVGVFDVSHMGEFWVKGPHALDFLQTVTSNNVAALTPGKVQYTCFPNEDGGIVDDLLVYRYEQEKYLLVVNASNIEKDWNWCMSHNTMGAELENASDRMAQLAVQGPKAIEALQKLTPVNLSELSYYTFTHGEFAGEPDVIISNTGYTGAGGFELYFYPEAAIKIWNAVFEAGAEFGIKPIGLGARDTLRLEMGFCLYGNDLDDTTSPIEAGLGWITKFVEGKNFINRPMLEKQKTEGTVRKLVGFEMVDRGIPRHGYELQNLEGTPIGVVTSGTMSPTRKIGIGMGYVKPEYSKVGTEICIDLRRRLMAAVAVLDPDQTEAGGQLDFPVTNLHFHFAPLGEARAADMAQAGDAVTNALDAQNKVIGAEGGDLQSIARRRDARGGRDRCQQVARAGQQLTAYVDFAGHQFLQGIKHHQIGAPPGGNQPKIVALQANSGVEGGESQRIDRR